MRKIDASRTTWALAITLVIVTIISRFIPHPPNWTAMGALALWSGCLFRDRWLAWTAPLMAMLCTDLIIGLHETMIWVYGSFALVTGIGLLIHPEKSIARTVAGTLSASILFFVVTNFGQWLISGQFQYTWQGLSTCYAVAIPFFSNQVSGDIVYSGVFAAAYFLAQKIKKTAPSVG